MIDHTQLKNMPQLLNALEIQSGSSVILKYMSDLDVISVTAPAFFEDVRKCTAKLYDLGLSGKHIGIMGTNRCEWMVHLCAIFQIGSVAVLLAPDLNPQDLTARAEQTDIFCILHDAALTETVQQVPHVITCSMDDPLPSHAPAAPLCCPDPEPGDLSCILFTSGTTAQCKAVMLSHKAMIAGICHNVIHFPFHSQLAILPLHHIAGFASVLNTWYLNRVICLGTDFKNLFRYLEYMKADYTLTVPSLLQVILRRLKKGGKYGHLLGWDLHLIGCGGAQFQPDVIQALNDQGIRVLQSYGATEAGGLGFDWEMTPECRDTIGKPCPEIQTKIVDGELFLYSDSLMMGYYKDPEATKEVLIDGWYATGDLCVQDEEGYLRLVGRKKNLIILSNGENVSPEEIEAKLSACDAICEVMVGVENDRILASVYPHLPEPCSEEQRTQIHSQIQLAIDNYNAAAPTYKQVHNVRFFQEPFAKTQVGKMIRSSVTGVKQA